MAVHPQPLLRRVRLPGQDEVSARSAEQSPLAVLYLPVRVRDRVLVRDRLAKAGALVTMADDVPNALQALGARRFGLVVVDLATERTSIAAVRLICAQFPSVPVVGLMDATQPLVASEAIYAGATDLLPWPFDERDAAIVFAAARDAVAIDSPPVSGATERLFEYSASMRAVSAALKSAASRRTSVLISGEAGSGRHLLARTLHERDHDYVIRPLAMVDCAAEGPAELERRLFGTVTDHDAGAGQAVPTGRASAVIAAQGGSLLLSHVADAPARIQTRLAQLLRDREVFSVDLQETVPIDLRLIGIVGPDVNAALSDGRMRRDLFDRLAQVRIDMPALRERREDIPLLAAYFLRRACDAEGAGAKRFSRSALTLLAALPWRGNARELRDAVTAAVRAARQPVIQLEDVLEHVDLSAGPGDQPRGPMTLREARVRFERDCISATLVRHHGRVGAAAKALGLQRTNLYRKVRQLNVPRALLSPRK